jgi:hypothetical protein
MRPGVDRRAADTEAASRRLSIDDAFARFTLDDRGREGVKITGETSIPTRYRNADGGGT